MSKLETIDTLTDIINNQKLLLGKVEEKYFDYFVEESTGKLSPNMWKNNRIAGIQDGITFLENEVNKIKGAIK